jgi:hypothetical protein
MKRATLTVAEEWWGATEQPKSGESNEARFRQVVTGKLPVVLAHRDKPQRVVTFAGVACGGGLGGRR